MLLQFLESFRRVAMEANYPMEYTDARISQCRETRSASLVLCALESQLEICHLAIASTKIPQVHWSTALTRRTSASAHRLYARCDPESFDSTDQSVRSSSLESLIHKLRRREVAAAVHDDQARDNGEIIQGQENDAPSWISVKCCEKIGQVFDPHKPIRICWDALFGQC